MKKLSTVKKIIIHHSASTFGTERDIHIWHTKRGFDDTGYHYVILNDEPDLILDGMICPGRSIGYIGAHCKGENHDSLGVCLIGNGVFTVKQYNALWFLLKQLCSIHNLDIEKDVYGHDWFVQTKCPGFGVVSWVLERNLEDNGENTVPGDEPTLAERVEKIEKTLKRLGY